jgi:hypothetical protein
MMFFTCFFWLMGFQDTNILKPIFDDLFESLSSENIGPETDFHLVLNESTNIDAYAGVSPKGNGALIIGDLVIRVYDDHDDGLIYQNHLLDFTLKDLNGDGFKDMILNGVAITSDDDEVITGYHSIVLVFYYEPEQKRFNPKLIKIPESINPGEIFWSRK